MAKRKQQNSQNGEDMSSQAPKKSAKGGRRPWRSRNRDNEILDHHWEVVYDDSPRSRRDKKKPKERPESRKVDTEKVAKKEEKEAKKPVAAELPAKEKEIAHKKKRRRSRKKSMAARPESKLEARQEPQPANEPAAPRATATQTKDVESQTAETAETPIKKKKRPARKRRKKRPDQLEQAQVARQEVEAEVEIEPAAECPQAAPRQPEKPVRDVSPRIEAAAAEGSFWDMQLSATTQAALRAADYLEPTPVQAGFIPKAILGADLMAQARTGTGKTAAFAIPILEVLDTVAKHRGPQALILVPTRELAVQVRDECVKLAAGSKIRIVAVYGGKPIRQQMEKLKRGAEIVVGTPGRVMDHMSRGTLFLGDLRIAVLDEADRMLDIGFRPDIEKILRQCPQSRQTLLLSATIPPPVKRLAERYMRDAEMLDFSPEDVAVETIEQFYFTVDAERKFDLLVKLLEREKPRQAIIFCRTRRGTERIHQRLLKKEPGVACIHGDLQQRVRDRVMSDFRAGKIRLLLATDVVGRGIDVSSVSHIINFDTPEFCDDYVHRVGRTGRMGREGVAYSFVTPEEGNELTRIEMRINRLLKRDEIAGLSSELVHKPEPTEENPEEKPETKPVFGRRERRIRRAL